MRRLAVLLSFAVGLVCQDLFASAKNDSIVTFLGGAHAKFVWQRFAWCNEDYQPKSEAAAMAEGWSLELLDTRTDTHRTLTTGLRDFAFARISRSGKWVTYIDIPGTTTYIIDLTAASPAKKVLLSKSDCTYWAALAWWVDQTNGDEYVFCLDNMELPGSKMGGGDGIWRIKVKSDGTADRSTATKLTINGLVAGIDGYKIDVAISVSADGKKLGGAFPWPDTKILDIPTGRLDLRHHEGFGCMCCLAPDNSYRFFHCEGDHIGIYMFDANMSTTNWFFDLKKSLDGYSGTVPMDFTWPRWTNHPQYFVCNWPMGNDVESYTGNGFGHLGLNQDAMVELWSKDANWVKTQMNMNRVCKGYLGEFSSDFRSQEKSILVASDPRYFQIGIDGWICNGTTYGNQCTSVSTSPAIRGDYLRGLSVVQGGGFVNIEANGNATVHITDARGRLVRRETGSGLISLDTRGLALGAYFVSTIQQGNRFTNRLTIAE